MTSLGVVLATELQPGTYVCVRTRSLFGRLIRLLTRSQFDHTFIVLPDALIAEATVWGVRVDRLAAYRGCLAVANAAEPMTGAQRAAVAASARSKAGRKYNWDAIVVIALRLAGLRWRWLALMADEKNADICSELVCQSGQAASPPMPWQCGEPGEALVRPDELGRREPFMVAVAWA